MVSPTWADTSAGVNTRFSITIWMVAACAGTATAPSANASNNCRPDNMGLSLFQARRNLFGVLLVALEDFQSCLQQALQLGVAGRRNQQGFQRAVDCLVIGYFVGDIGLVVIRALELVDFGELVGGLLGQRLAGVV